MSDTPAQDMDWSGRFLVTLVTLTLIAQLVSLQLREAIFGGMGWLTFVKYTAWSERLGLVLIVAIFCIASVGLWMMLWTGVLHRLLKVEHFKALAFASASWVALLFLDYMVRQKVFELLGNAFDLFGVSSGVGGLGRMMSNVWSWYADLILITLAACVALGIGSYFLIRFFRNTQRSWGPIDQISARAVQRTVIAANVVALTFLTACSAWWPITRDLIADDTLVGAPLGILVSATTDFDGDGYSQFDNPSDSAPFDASRHPHALDVPDDGVDQDLLAGDLEIEALDPAWRERLDAMLRYPEVRFNNRLNVMLIVLESVRHDAFDTRIDDRYVTPRMRQMVEDQSTLRIPHAYAAKGYTQATMMHLFWGGFFHPGSTLIDDFKQNGYQLSAFSGYDLADEGFELNLGLDQTDLTLDARHDDRLTLPAKTLPARHVAEHVTDFIQNVDTTERPFFTYVFFEDAHFPYGQDNPHVFSSGPLARSDITPDNAEALRRVYFNHVFHMDAAVGDIMDALSQRGLQNNTLVVVISDHGESLFDDGLLLGHGIALNDIMTRCLALIAHPTRDVPEMISHYHVRGLLREMLTQPPVAQPRITPVPGRTLLQFLGNPTRPSSIASISLEHGRLVYDFKLGSVLDERNNTLAHFEPDELSGEVYRRAQQLIWAWEYLQWISRDLARWNYDY